MISIINHSVQLSRIELLQFMYPEYQITDKPVLFTTSPIIFTGETKYINQIKKLNVPYIIVSTLAEYNLDDRLTLLDIAFSKYNRNIPKYLLEYYEKLDDIEFMELFEYFWITGKWPLKSYDGIGKFVELLRSFKTDTYNITKTYVNLLDECSAEYLETCLFTFLNKVLKVKSNSSTGKQSKWYTKVLLEYAQLKRNYIKPAVDNYINSKIENPELRIYNLIINLNKMK